MINFVGSTAAPNSRLASPSGVTELAGEQVAWTPVNPRRSRADQIVRGEPRVLPSRSAQHHARGEFSAAKIGTPGIVAGFLAHLKRRRYWHTAKRRQKQR